MSAIVTSVGKNSKKMDKESRDSRIKCLMNLPMAPFYDEIERCESYLISRIQEASTEISNLQQLVLKLECVSTSSTFSIQRAGNELRQRIQNRMLDFKASANRSNPMDLISMKILLKQEVDPLTMQQSTCVRQAMVNICVDLNESVLDDEKRKNINTRKFSEFRQAVTQLVEMFERRKPEVFSSSSSSSSSSPSFSPISPSLSPSTIVSLDSSVSSYSHSKKTKRKRKDSEQEEEHKEEEEDDQQRTSSSSSSINITSSSSSSSSSSITSFSPPKHLCVKDRLFMLSVN